MQRLAFLSAFVLAFASSAYAQVTPRTAIVRFEGNAAAPGIERRVRRILVDRTPVVETSQVNDAAESASVSGLEENGVAQLASELGAELVVQGNVTGTRRAPRLEMVVRSPDGAELVRGESSHRGGAWRDFDNEVGEIFDRALAERSRRATPTAPSPRVHTPENEGETPPPRSVAPDDGLAIIALVIGDAVRTREASVELDTGGTPGYSVPAYPELRIGIEARPFANDTHLGRGLFINGFFGHSLGLTSRVSSPMCNADPTQPNCTVSSNFARFAIGAGYLAPLENVIELGGGFTVGYDGFHFGPNVAFPTTEYVYLRPGVRARIRLMQEALVLDAEVAYRGAVSVGAIAETYGDGANAHAIDLVFTAGGNFFPLFDLGFTWAVRFDFVKYFLFFSGPSTGPPADTGEDASFGASFLVGWSIR
jgi:hypothetical protein